MLRRVASIEVTKCLMFIRLRNSPVLLLLPGCPLVSVVPVGPCSCRIRGVLGRKSIRKWRENQRVLGMAKGSGRGPKKWGTGGRERTASVSVDSQINLETKLAHGLLTSPGEKGFLRSMLCLGGKERDEACTRS